MARFPFGAVSQSGRAAKQERNLLECPQARRQERLRTLTGQGIGLARWSLAIDEIELGRLALPFPNVPPLPTGLAYYIVAPRESLRREPVANFRNWVLEEARTLEPPALRLPERPAPG